MSGAFGWLLVVAGCASTGARAPPPHFERGPEVVLTAMNFLDVRYRYGGNSASEGFDCSGFTRHVYQRSVGLQLPRRAEAQAGADGLLEVPRAHLQPGDLVFFDTLGRKHSHVGIYVGDGRFVHAPKAGAQVRVESLRGAYWSRRYDSAWRPAARRAAARVTNPPDL